MALKINLERVAALCIGGTWIEIDPDQEMEYDDECKLVDAVGDTVVESETPVLRFHGTDGHAYVVSLNAAAFRLHK